MTNDKEDRVAQIVSVSTAIPRTPEDCRRTAQEWSEFMASKLAAGAAKGKPHWLEDTTSIESLVLHLFAETHELFDATNEHELMREAADIANLAFMIAQRIALAPAMNRQRAREAVRLVRQCYNV